ncbi:MAG: DMT family transporter [Thermoproteus sp.]
MRAYAYPLVVAAIWGLAYPLTKYLVAFFSPGFIAFFRALVGFLMLSAVSKPSRLDWRVAAAGVLNMGATVLLINLSVMLSNSPGLVSSLMYTQPLFLIALSAALLRTQVKASEALGVALGVLGVVISAMGSGASLYDLLPVLGGFIWALGTVAYRQWLAERPPTATTATMNGVAAMFLLPAAALSWRASFTVRATLLLITLAVLAQGVAWLLWFRSVRELGPVKVGELSLLVPVFAYLFSYLAFGAIPTADQIVGSALILLGILTIYIGAAKLK